MGRFFNVASPEFVDDIIYQPPWELMKEAINTHDTRIGEQEQVLEDSDGLLAELNNLQGDNPEVNKAIQGYRDGIQELTGNLQGDYANYQKQIPNINNLKRKLQQDMDNGLLGRAQEAFNDREAEVKRLDGLKGDPTKTAAIKKFYDLNYKDRGNLGFKDKDNYNKFIAESLNPVDKFDSAKFLNDLRANIVADKTASASAGPGSGYIWTKNNTKKYVDKNRVSEIMKDHPALRDWETDTRQDLMLEGNNELGLRGEELNEFIENGLATGKEEYLNSALNQLVYSQEGATKGVSVDGKAAADTAFGRSQSNRGVFYDEFEVDIDKRQTQSKKADSQLVERVIKKSLTTDKGYETPDQVEGYILNGTSSGLSYREMAKHLGESPAAIRMYVENLHRQGVYSNLAKPREGDYEEDGTLKHDAVNRLNREEKFIKEIVSNIDASKMLEVETGTNYRKGTKMHRSTLTEIVNLNFTKSSTLGGTVSKKDIKKVAEKTAVTIGAGKNKETIQAFTDTKGKPIKNIEGEYAQTKEQAVEYASRTGVKPLMNTGITYQNQAGETVNVTSEAKMETFTPKLGKPQIQVTFNSKNMANGKIEEVRVLIPREEVRVNSN